MIGTLVCHRGKASPHAVHANCKPSTTLVSYSLAVDLLIPSWTPYTVILTLSLFTTHAHFRTARHKASQISSIRVVRARRPSQP